MTASPQVSIRLGVQGAEETVRALQRVGAGGKTALDQVAKATASATRGLRQVEEATRPASRAMQALGLVTANVRDRITSTVGAMTGQLGVLGRALTALGPVGAGVGVAVGAALYAVSKFSSSAVASLEKVYEAGLMAKRVGIGGEQLGALKLGFRRTGGDPEQLETMLIRLQDHLGDVLEHGKDIPKELATGFGKLGVAYADIVKHGGDAAWIIERLAVGLAKLKTPAEQIKALRDVFGRQGAGLRPLFLQGPESWRKTFEEMKKRGMFPSAETKAAAPEVHFRREEAQQIASTQRTEVLRKSHVAEWSLMWDEANAVFWRGLNRFAEAEQKAWEQIKASFGQGWKGFRQQWGREWGEFSAGFAASWKSIIDPIAAAWKDMTDKLVGAWGEMWPRIKAAMPDWFLAVIDKAAALLDKTGAPPGAETPKKWPQEQPPGGVVGKWQTTQAPRLAPAVPSARPVMVAPFDYKFAGSFDVNVHGKADVRRARTSDPRIRLNVNQGLSAVGH